MTIKMEQNNDLIDLGEVNEESGVEVENGYETESSCCLSEGDGIETECVNPDSAHDVNRLVNIMNVMSNDLKDIKNYNATSLQCAWIVGMYALAVCGVISISNMWKMLAH